MYQEGRRCMWKGGGSKSMNAKRSVSVHKRSVSTLSHTSSRCPPSDLPEQSRRPLTMTVYEGPSVPNPSRPVPIVRYSPTASAQHSLPHVDSEESCKRADRERRHTAFRISAPSASSSFNFASLFSASATSSLYVCSSLNSLNVSSNSLGDSPYGRVEGIVTHRRTTPVFIVNCRRV